MWKNRVADARARMCSSPPTTSAKLPSSEWVSKCWTILTASLHDDVYRKVNHVQRGCIKSLLDEVAHALVVDNLEEVPVLRMELYGATMQKDCANDLQLWINFIVERGNKLDFLKKTVSQDELVTIFLKGLHPVFNCINQLQVYFGVPGQLPKTFEAAVTTVRKFAATPIVASELAKLKTTGMSQNMFPFIPQSQPSQQSRSASSNRTRPSNPANSVLCRQFASSGRCQFGARCKFQHTATPASSGAASTPTNHSQSQSQPQRSSKCTFFQRFGHASCRCNF